MMDQMTTYSIVASVAPQSGAQTPTEGRSFHDEGTAGENVKAFADVISSTRRLLLTV